MKKKQVEIIKKITESECYRCSGKGKVDNKPCIGCAGTGQYKHTHYFHIVNGICFDGDTLK